MQLFLVRHGETNWNKEKRFQGWAPIPLNETGKAQARELGKYLSNYSFQFVASSDLLRARETTQIIVNSINYKGRIRFYKGLRELNAGVFQGLTEQEFSLLAKHDSDLKTLMRKDSKHAKNQQQFTIPLNKNKNVKETPIHSFFRKLRWDIHKPEKGESILGFRYRVLKTIHQIIQTSMEKKDNARRNQAQKNSSQDLVLVITHGGVLRQFLGWIKGLSLPEIMAQKQGNLAVNIVSYNEQTQEFEILKENYTPFLND